MNSPVHHVSIPSGCTVVVDDPLMATQREHREREGVTKNSFIDLSQPRTLSPATSLDRFPPPAGGDTAGGGGERGPLMHSTPYSKLHRQEQQQLTASNQIPAPIHPPSAHNVTSSGSAQLPVPVDESREATERDKWQFPIDDQPPQNYNGGYDSDVSEPSPYAYVKNIIADVEPRHDPIGVPQGRVSNQQHGDPGYEHIELRCLPSLPNSRPHSRLGGYTVPWQTTSPRRTGQPRSLKAALRETRGLSQTVQKQLRKADEFLCSQQLKEAISHLEWSLLQTNEYPQIQSLIWMLLGNAHVGLNDFSKASVCHLHYLAFCRERNDFPGMTKAECSLGIAYMKLGLYKLAGRCFLQYLENCHLLQDDKGVTVAYNNLGLLSKILATEGYTTGMKEGNSAKAEEMLKSHLKRAVTYFEQHLGLEEQLGSV